MSPKKPFSEPEIISYSDTYESEVYNLVQNYFDESLKDYDSEIHPDALLETIRTADHDNAFLMIVDGKVQGLMAGIIIRSYLNHKPMYQQYIWYTNPGFGHLCMYLLTKVMEVLKNRRIEAIIISILESRNAERLKRIYEHRGFRPLESHYLRNL